MFIRCLYRTILIVVILCVIIVSTAAGLMGDECDWTGSGVSGRGVRPVYLRCSAGRIRWRYPRGALRVLVRAPPGARACVRVLRAARPPPALAEHAAALRAPGGPGGRVTWDEFPARVFVEGPGVLTPLFAPDDGLDSTVRCFRVRGGGGRAALYVEAAGAEGAARAAALRYEVRAPRPAEYDPSSADCRPCDDAEAAMAFCTADLVARGIITSIEERRDLETSQLTLKLTKLIRHITEDGRLYQEDSLDDPLVDETYEVIDSNNDLLYNDTALADRKKRSIAASKDLYGSIHIPSSCGAMPGEGEFMFMASRRLGYLALTCAPRIDQWEVLMEKAKTEGTAHCLLSS